MKQFDLSLWLKDKSRKVVTRSGHDVRILCTDKRGSMPIVALVEFETLDGVQLYYSDGKNESCREYDLFFADEEEELSEFEKMLRYVLECYSGHEFASESEIETLKLNAKSLLNLARKELEKNYYTKVLDDRMVFKSELHSTDLQTAYDMGKQDALKDFPMWKKATENKEFDKYVLLFEDEERVVLTTELYKDEYYIEVEDLKTLSKEE